MKAFLIVASFIAATCLGLSGAQAHGRHHHRFRHHHHRHVRHVARHRPVNVGGLPVVNARLVAEARRYVGRGNFTGFHGPWCGAAMGAWVRQEGKPIPRNFRLARSWAHVGNRLRGPAVGALAVFRGHVTIVAGRTADGRIIGLGGNQGHMVRYSVYDPRRVLAFVGL